MKRLKELERTVVSVQLELEAASRHQKAHDGQPNGQHLAVVNLGITVPLHTGAFQNMNDEADESISKSKVRLRCRQDPQWRRCKE